MTSIEEDKPNKSVTINEELTASMIDEEQQDSEAGMPPSTRTMSQTTVLSDVGKMYDIDGDGKLDEAEQAMRDMDKTGRGYLTNDKVYELMLEHYNMQRSLLKSKRVVIGLGIFVILLTICNLGTSIAAAYLARETTINDKNELIDVDTGEAVSTQSMSDEFNYTRAYNETEGQRRLCAKTNGIYVCDTTSYLEIPLEEGQRLVRKCKKGETVNLKRTWLDGSDTMVALCPTRRGQYSLMKSRFQNGIEMSLTRYGSSATKDAAFYVLTGDDLIQELGEVCDETNDCADGLACMDDDIEACKAVCDKLRFGPSRLQPCYDECALKRSCQATFTDE